MSKQKVVRMPWTSCARRAIWRASSQFETRSNLKPPCRLAEGDVSRRKCVGAGANRPGVLVQIKKPPPEKPMGALCLSKFLRRMLSFYLFHRSSDPLPQRSLYLLEPDEQKLTSKAVANRSNKLSSGILNGNSLALPIGGLPSIARLPRSLGWTPSGNWPFEWLDGSTGLMVKSVFWRDGLGCKGRAVRGSSRMHTYPCAR